MLVRIHFKGHELGAFGGNLKNIAMRHDVFKHAHTRINDTRIIDYACELGMGSKEYELIKL